MIGSSIRETDTVRSIDQPIDRLIHKRDETQFALIDQPIDRLMYQERELEDDLIFDLDLDRLTDRSTSLSSRSTSLSRR